MFITKGGIQAFVLCFFAPVLYAQEHAPIPEKLVSARKLFLVNDSGDLKAYDKLYSELRKWGRFTIVTSQSTADAIVVLTSRAEYAVTVGTGTVIASGNVGTGMGTSVSVPGTYLHLKIFDATTGEPLWSDATEKWVTAGHAPSKLVSNLKKRMVQPRTKPE